MDVFDESKLSLDKETAGKYIADSGTVSSKEHLLVGAIDFGTTYSGYAFSWQADYKQYPLRIFTNTWSEGSSALMSSKTPTCVLFKPDGTFHSFGYEAEDKYAELALEEEQEGWRYFRRFKMQLYGTQCFNPSFTIKDDQGQSMPAIKVFTAAIKYLKDHLIQRCRNQTTPDIQSSDILWILTIPAIWSDESKQFMQKAAEAADIGRDHLMIAREPDVASLYCRKFQHKEKGEIDAFSSGSKHVVLDASGTVDITIHEIQRDGSLKEIHRPSGGDWGGTKVDHAFQLLISEIIGETAFRHFMENNMDDAIAFFREFEVKKRSIKSSVPSDKNIVFRTPISLHEACNYVNGQSIAAMIKANPTFNKRVSVHGERLRVSEERVMELFKDPLKHIVYQLENVLKKPSAREVTSILMVGGFSESPVLQDEIKRNFPTFRIIVPEEAGLAVLKGAVIFGHEPRKITSRIFKHTYGVDAVRVFNDEAHDISKRRVLSGRRVKCDDIFSIHARMGDTVKIGESQVIRTYVPIEPDQTGMEINVYRSKDRDPKYVTDPGCVMMGKLIIPMPDTSKGLVRSVQVQMTYHWTEILVKATYKETGECVGMACGI
ncbi:heat shock 70 kDa protein 12B-like [Argopecten irradians]|uniref:heat shock 70 kDa protein 12B-like n=1 Tax=Argopecten irradians TaxID=31199 RepID=UPI00371532F2